MAEIDDGGPAFPTPQFYEEKMIGCEPGLSLRDWLAGQALTGWLSSYGDDMGRPNIEDRASLAVWSYKMADAMLAARQKGGR